MQTVLDIQNIFKKFKAVQAVKNVSLFVSRGEIFGLLGPDGAGKSTLIYLCTGLHSPNAGKISLLENDMLADAEKIKPSLGILPQGLGLSLAAELSVEENIDYFAAINAVTREKREKLKNDLLQVTKLAEFRDRQAKNLSGGMKQKLGICCTLIHSPKMIFLDEPTTGVDPISRRDIWYLINKIVKENDITIFLTTSYMDEAERCHRVALMHQGEILAMGTPDELKKEFGGGKSNPTLEDIFLSKIMTKGTGANISALEEFFGGPKLGTAAKVPPGSGLTHSPQGQGLTPGFGGTLAAVPNFGEDKKIEVKNLYKYFGKFAAVNNVTFDVKRGEIFGFLGPNGAGKTTTIKMLCGLFPPSAGEGKILSFDIMREQWKIKKNIGYMSQKFSLYRDLTVGENIELYAGIYGVNPSEVIKRKELILKIADLEGKDSVITDSLPMGIKQRLALGCAIIHKPEVIFLDEPTSGVDPIARRIFWDIIFFLSRKIKVTILVTTHYMDEAEQCDRLSLMHMGKLIALGTPTELKGDVESQTGRLFEVLVDKPFDALDILNRQFHFCNIFGRTIHLYTKEPEADYKTMQKLFKENNIALLDAREKMIPFEDVFVYFCEKGEKG